MPDEKASTDALLKFIETEWRDIHHSRIQEWSALGVVTGAHFALTQLPKLMTDAKVAVNIKTISTLGIVLAIMFAVLGALLTCRHRRLMQVKLGWIFEAEEKLGIVKVEGAKYGVIPVSARMPTAPDWIGLSLPRLLSTSGLIFLFYVLFVVFDAALLHQLL